MVIMNVFEKNIVQLIFNFNQISLKNLTSDNALQNYNGKYKLIIIF